MTDYKHIDITELPSDPNGSLGQLRQKLLYAYNSNRNSKQKMELLGETLVFVLGRVRYNKANKVRELEDDLTKIKRELAAAKRKNTMLEKKLNKGK